MNSLYSLYVLLSAENNQIYIVSTKKNTVELPYAMVKHSKYLKQESRFNIVNFFNEHNILYSDECKYNFMDIGDHDSTNYISEINKEFNIDNDVCVTYGGLSKKIELKSNLFWKKLEFDDQKLYYVNNPNLNSVIDNVINKSTI